MDSNRTLLSKNFESRTFDSDNKVKCLFCDHEFDLSFKLNRNEQKINRLRKHLIVEHQFIISDINEIDDLNGYLEYWRDRIGKISDLKLICALIKTNTKPEDTGEPIDYFMLCPDVLADDRSLREELKLAKLNYLMNVQEIERNETDFERNCLFCRKTINGNRTNLFDHLNQIHNLKLGNPNNIVFVKEFLDLIERKLNAKICLYCERNFKDWQALKEHMRKKMHKHLNPHSKEYDEYYLINYLKNDTKWYKSKKTPDSDEDESNTFDDWVDNNGEECFNCLFCTEQHSKIEEFTNHLSTKHEFDFKNLDVLSFYNRIRIINYIRSRTKVLKCINCDLQFDTLINLNKHLINDRHNALPAENNWKSNVYYQPVLENDPLLRLIDGDDTNDSDEIVIPE